jgi:hypothetical protein
MFEVVNALLRAGLDEACVDGPTHEDGDRALVPAKALESVPRDGSRADNIGAVKRQAVLPAPSMWN